MIKKIRFLYFLIISFLCSTHMSQDETPLRKELLPDDIKRLATEIFKQYIKAKKINTKNLIIESSITVSISSIVFFTIYKMRDTNFSDLIRNIFSRKNSLKIDKSKQDAQLPSFLDQVEFNNNQDKFFLFYGPPGTGKSFAASVLAAKKECFYKETDGNIFNVESYVGTDIEKINKFFTEIKTLASKNPKQKIVALIDEFESIGDRNNTNRQEQSKINCGVNLMLTKMDEIKNKYPNIYIIFTTNYREKIDNALLSRCTVQIPFELPTSDIIKDLFGKHFRSCDNNNEDKDKDFITKVQNVINLEHAEEKKSSFIDLISEAGNYDATTYDFWFGVLDLELNKTEIEIKCISSNQDKEILLTNKKKILETYKNNLQNEKNFFHFFGTLAHWHQFNLRDINSLIEKKEEVKNQDDFIKLFSDKIRYKGFIKKSISKTEEINIKKQIIVIDSEQLKRKIDRLTSITFQNLRQENN